MALQAQVAARASIAVSQENAQSIAASSVQTNQGLNGVNAKVDGHLTALMATIAALTLKVSNLEQAKAIAQIEAVHAESNTSQILTAIAAIPAVVVPAEVVPPPAGAQLGDHQ